MKEEQNKFKHSKEFGIYSCWGNRYVYGENRDNKDKIFEKFFLI